VWTRWPLAPLCCGCSTVVSEQVSESVCPGAASADRHLGLCHFTLIRRTLHSFPNSVSGLVSQAVCGFGPSPLPVWLLSAPATPSLLCLFLTVPGLPPAQCFCLEGSLTALELLGVRVFVSLPDCPVCLRPAVPLCTCGLCFCLFLSCRNTCSLGAVMFCLSVYCCIPGI
jgi:hypothetical protein